MMSDSGGRNQPLDACAGLTYEELKAIEVEAMADDVLIEMERMREWTGEKARADMRTLNREGQAGNCMGSAVVTGHRMRLFMNHAYLCLQL